MAQNPTGTTWDGAGLGDIDSRFLERTKKSQLLVRDARGAATNISPHNPDGSIRWSPFAADQKWRDDFTLTRKIDGAWVTNPVQPNEGLHIGGAFKDGDGPSANPKIKSDDFMVEQTDFPFDSDLVEQSEAFSFTPVETAKPVVRRLRNLQALNDAAGNSLVEDPGQLNAGWGRALDSENIGRQFFFVREYRKDGLPIIKVEGYALAKSTDFGKSKMGKKDSEASELSYQPIPDGYFMAMVDGVYRPILKYTWVGGAGWTALGGIPVVSATVPTATPGATGTLTLAFPVPTGTGDPWQYKGQFSTDNGVTWGAALTPSNVTVAGGVVTLSFTGVAAGLKKFRGQVTGTNGAVAVTPSSAAVTIA